MAGSVRLSGNASALATKGRPWFFGDDLVGRAPEDGTLVRVLSERGRDLGLGFYSEHSKLKLRLCGPWLDSEAPPAEDEFLRRRLAEAIERRAGLRGPRAGVRLVHGEADGLPGVVVDQYGTCAVLQVSAAAAERHIDSIVALLVELAGAESVLARNDVQVRRLEGLQLGVRWLHGDPVEEVEIEENGLVHVVRPAAGHKTGFYLDQRPARQRVREHAAGRRVLDLFSYQGGFALAALAGGASEAIAVDQSAEALELAQRVAERNDLSGLTVRRENVFDALRELRAADEFFDLIIVDPPAFAKSRREQRAALRGYRDLNRNALRALAPGGLLVTCSCSYHVSGAEFEDVLRQGTAGLPFRVLMRERIGAGEDHPAWLGLPESEYLKVRVLERQR